MTRGGLPGVQAEGAAVSIFVAVLVVRSAWDILRRSTRILMEASPPSLDIEALAEDVQKDFPEIEACGREVCMPKPAGRDTHHGHRH